MEFPPLIAKAKSPIHKLESGIFMATKVEEENKAVITDCADVENKNGADWRKLFLNSSYQSMEFFPP